MGRTKCHLVELAPRAVLLHSERIVKREKVTRNAGYFKIENNTFRSIS